MQPSAACHLRADGIAGGGLDFAALRALPTEEVVAELADVAAKVGLITTSVTYYYRKKDDLAAACFMRGLERFDALVNSLEIGKPPRGSGGPGGSGGGHGGGRRPRHLH